MSEMDMNGLCTHINEKARIAISIENIERNIAIWYMNGVLAFSIALFVSLVTATISLTQYPKLSVIGWGVSAVGFCLTGWFAIRGYQFKKRFNLLLEEMAQDKEGNR